MNCEWLDGMPYSVVTVLWPPEITAHIAMKHGLHAKSLHATLQHIYNHGRDDL